MITFFGHHEVADFDAWLEAGKAHEHEEPPSYVDTHVYRTTDGKSAIVTHTFNTLEDAEKFKAMAESSEFQAMIKQLGGKPPFTFWLAEKVPF